jgi:serine/threonine protein kinase
VGARLRARARRRPPDVKPDNILLEAGTGRAVVTDFGIAHRGTDPVPDADPGGSWGPPTS